ncbi:MAG: hypothetical protein ACKOE2_07910, partial [Actinomycetales bacterium]
MISLSAGLLALIALPAVWRRMRRPTLDLRALHSRGAVSVFVVVVAVNGVNLFFFTYLMLQYRYHQSLFETALYLIVPQGVAAIAAIAGGRLGARWGSAPVAIGALFGAAVLSLGALLVSAESSPWVPYWCCRWRRFRSLRQWARSRTPSWNWRRPTVWPRRPRCAPRPPISVWRSSAAGVVGLGQGGGAERERHIGHHALAGANKPHLMRGAPALGGDHRAHGV